MDRVCSDQISTDDVDVIVISSGESLLSASDALKQKLTSSVNHTIAVGAGFKFYREVLDAYPIETTYLDTFSSLIIFKDILEKKEKVEMSLTLCSPILTTSHEIQRIYIGNSSTDGSVNWRTYYPTYLKQLKRLEDYIRVQKIKSTSFRRLYPKRHQKLVDGGGLFLDHKEFLDILTSNTSPSQMCVMEMWTVGRLTTYILPLLYFYKLSGKLNFSRILLAGFDGHKPKFCGCGKMSDRDSRLSKIWEKEYRYYMPMWQSLFLTLGVEILKITPSSSMESVTECLI